MKNPGDPDLVSPSPAGRDAASKPDTAVGGTVRTLAILAFFAQAREPRSVAEVARGTGMNPSTAFNIVKTLVASGFLRPSGASRRYAIGPAAIALSAAISEHSLVHELASMAIGAFARRFDVGVSLWQRSSRFSMQLITAVEPDSLSRIKSAVGLKLPLLHGSMGRIMATESDLTEAESRQVFGLVNLERPMTYKDFTAEALFSKQRGWSVDDGHVRKAITSVSTALRGPGPVSRICTATMFRGQYEGAELVEFADALCAMARRLDDVALT